MARDPGWSVFARMRCHCGSSRSQRCTLTCWLQELRLRASLAALQKRLSMQCSLVMPLSALAIPVRARNNEWDARTRTFGFWRLGAGGGGGSGSVRFQLSVPGGIVAAPRVGAWRCHIPVADMGLRRQNAMVGVVGLFFSPVRRTKCSPLWVTMEPQTATVGSLLGFAQVPFSFFGRTAGV